MKKKVPANSNNAISCRYSGYGSGQNERSDCTTAEEDDKNGRRHSHGGNIQKRTERDHQGCNYPKGKYHYLHMKHFQ